MRDLPDVPGVAAKIFSSLADAAINVDMIVWHPIEVKGKTKQADKRDITQLDSWVRRALNSGYKSDELEGVLVINHDRREDPTNRTETLTDKAKEFLKHYNYKFFTTKFLFDNIKKFINKSINEEIKTKIINGEKIE